MKEGTVASTVGYDSHNLTLAGASENDMLVAARVLVDGEGGMVVVGEGKALAHVPLPIAALMSDKSVETVSNQVEELKNAWRSLSSTPPSPHITLAFTTLSVIPQLRITDEEPLDAVHFKFVSPPIE